MAQKQLRTARATGAALGFVKATSPDISEYTSLHVLDQRHSPIDWLAARARVAVPTARLFAELHGFGGANA